MSHARYAPGPIPDDCPPALKAWLADELRRIRVAFLHTSHLDVLGMEPLRPDDGMLVYANGTTWNPGSGEGFYGYENGNWVKL
jgi:hypothetical protein